MKLFLILTGLLILTIFVFSFYQTNSSLISPLSSSYGSNLQTPTAAPLVGQPVRLIIPKLAINTVIESVGLNTLGNMDVPVNADQVGWYNLGYRPGQPGSAVVAGHLDKNDGTKAIFADLKSLQAGDQIEVIDEYNQTYLYLVTDIKDYLDQDFPLNEVFNSKDIGILNLITCAGQFNSQTSNYSHRTVVKSILTNN